MTAIGASRACVRSSSAPSGRAVPADISR